jgi:hypothetical protein
LEDDFVSFSENEGPYLMPNKNTCLYTRKNSQRNHQGPVGLMAVITLSLLILSVWDSRVMHTGSNHLDFLSHIRCGS